MAAHAHISRPSAENIRMGGLASRFMVPFLIIGLLGLAGTVFFALRDIDRTMQGYLVSFLFFTAIGLGALFFVILHHITRAGWSVVLRRLAEGLSTNLLLMAILFLPIIYVVLTPEIDLFNWAEPDRLEPGPLYDGLLAHKAGYLNVTFFLIRAAFYFLAWIFLSRYFFRLSVRQDETADVELSHRMTAASAPAVVLFALTLTFASFDWIMSQDHHWFSTIFGVYFFAGAVGSFLALLILVGMTLQRAGRLEHSISIEHYHDLGKLLFAFGMIFWAYIGFSQYLLQWYANIPEETNWWQARVSGLDRPENGLDFQPGAWNTWSAFLFIGHFAAPFLAVISRWPKRVKPLLAVAAAWMLFMGWFDIYWLVMPVFHPEAPMFALSDFAPLIGIGGIFLAAATFQLRNVPLVPQRDPRLNESLAFENA